MTSGKRSFDQIPAIVDACTYGTEWVKWWTAAQPRGRDTQQWPFPKTVNDDGGWRKFPANGKDGIFTAVMALSWWAHTIRSPSEIPFFEEATADLHWVIQELIRIKTPYQLSPSLPPPPAQSEDNSHPSDPTSDPPVSSSCSRPPSSRRVPTCQHAEGKRVVKPTWKAKAIQ